MTDTLIQNVHAVHICHWDEYVSSLRAMIPWMVAYNNNWCGRWQPHFWSMHTSLTAEQILFLRNDFAQSTASNPYSNMALDMWIECAMNKGSKIKSGWLSILKKEILVLVHSSNVNNIVQIRQPTYFVEDYNECLTEDQCSMLYALKKHQVSVVCSTPSCQGTIEIFTTVNETI